jgi:hypothetical protein
VRNGPKTGRALYHDRFEELDFDGHLSAYASYQQTPRWPKCSNLSLPDTRQQGRRPRKNAQKKSWRRRSMMQPGRKNSRGERILIGDILDLGQDGLLSFGTSGSIGRPRPVPGETHGYNPNKPKHG